MNATYVSGAKRSRRRLQFSVWTVLTALTMSSCALAVMRREGLHPALVGGYLALGTAAALAPLLLSGRRRRLAQGGAIVLVAGMTATLLFLPPSLHYRLFGDERSLNYVLSKQVQAGDSLACVQSLLGQGNTPGGAERARLLVAAAEFADRWPEQYPDGNQPEDDFLGFRTGGVVIFLQFRSGSLVNYNPQDFEQPLMIGTTW